MDMPFSRVRGHPSTPGPEFDDDDVDAVIFRNLWRHHRLLPPSSDWQSYWDVMMLAFVIYNSVFIPMEIGFAIQKPVAQCSVDYTIDLLFVLDMVLSMRTTYYDSDMELVLDSNKIYRRYLTSWFLIDFPAVFPFEVFSSAGITCVPDAEGGDNNDLVTLTKMPKIIRLLRLARFVKRLDKLGGASLLRIVVSLCGFLLIAHIVACIWWVVGFYSYQDDEAMRAALQLVDVQCDGSRPCSWLRRVPVMSTPLSPDSTLGQKYLSSLYWSLTTLMKTPWIGPDTISEKIFGSFAVAVGAIFFAGFLSTVTANASNFDKMSAQKNQRLGEISAFGEHYGISASLRSRLRDHSDMLWKWTDGISNTLVLQHLPSSLRGTVALQLYSEVRADGTGVFNKCSIECVKGLLVRLIPQVVLADELLIAKGEAVKKLYFLVRGALNVACDAGARLTTGRSSTADSAHSRNGSPVSDRSSARRSTGNSFGTSKAMGTFRAIEKPGACIGLVEPVAARAAGVYPVCVSATKTTMLLFISQPDLAAALDHFPEDVSVMRRTLQQEHKSMLDSLKVRKLPGSPLVLAEDLVARLESDINMEPGAYVELHTRIQTVERKVFRARQLIGEIRRNAGLLNTMLKVIQKDRLQKSRVPEA